MIFADFLKKSKKSMQAAANELGVTTMTLNRYCRGICLPRPKMMKKIADWSDGKVQFSDFYENYRGDGK